MKDYFREFLTSKGLSALADAPPGEGIDFAKIKTHALWTLAAVGIAVASWKAGKWYAGYELLRQKSTQQG